MKCLYVDFFLYFGRLTSSVCVLFICCLLMILIITIIITQRFIRRLNAVGVTVMASNSMNVSAIDVSFLSVTVEKPERRGVEAVGSGISRFCQILPVHC